MLEQRGLELNLFDFEPEIYPTQSSTISQVENLIDKLLSLDQKDKRSTKNTKKKETSENTVIENRSRIDSIKKKDINETSKGIELDKD